MSREKIEKNCNECLHFEACCKWTDFPKQIGFPTCRKFAPISGYRKQSEGEWVEKDDGFGGVYYDCTACGCSWTTIDGTPMENNMNYCPECGAKMKGGGE